MPMKRFVKYTILLLMLASCFSRCTVWEEKWTEVRMPAQMNADSTGTDSIQPAGNNDTGQEGESERQED